MPVRRGWRGKRDENWSKDPGDCGDKEKSGSRKEMQEKAAEGRDDETAKAEREVPEDDLERRQMENVL